MTMFQKKAKDIFFGKIDDAFAIYNPLTFQLGFAHSLDSWRKLSPFQEKEPLDALLEKERDTLRGRHISVLSIIPTFTCNNRCGYCSMRHIPSHIDPVSMDIAQAQQCIDRFFEWSSPHSKKEILIFGGEPLCNFPVTRSIIEYSKHRDECSITLFTNGTLLDEETARFLSRFDVNVIVSIDGEEEEHNRARPLLDGSGSYQDAVRGYLRAKGTGCVMGLSMQIGRHNIHNFSSAIDELYGFLRPDRISIGSNFHPLQGGVRNPFQVDTAQATSLLLEIYYRYKEQGICIDQVDRRIRPFVTGRCKGKDCTGCGKKLVALPDGRMGFCEYLAYPGEAYIPAERFSPDSVDYERFNKISPLFKEQCIECPALSICGGGCFYNALMFSGSVTGLDVLNCEQTLYILDWMVEKLWNGLQFHPEHTPIYLVTQQDKENILGSFTSDGEALSCNGVSRIAE